MPTISYFFGIYILMHVREHAPPHFHARYEGKEVFIDIQTGAVLQDKKSFSKRALRFIEEWRQMHVTELMENWDLLAQLKTPRKIKPLED